ncbi:MAG: CDP-diacylglycerol--glycerol-3-phosphate 3-phosphatidyltransferase [Chromatiales bacterium]|nr:CDP-diacylglycerol--glycerol-3-phosphate 3-phosphatidyltransferase [Chromatiales bacterium]
MNSLPNYLTILRILLIPVFVLFYYIDIRHGHLIATVFFALAGLTDWLDGYLARKLEVTSAFGAFLDPVADKLMVATALILIVDSNPTPYSGIWLALPAAVIVGREITISALREWMAEVGASSKVAVSMLGKVKTTAQMLALVLLIYGQPVAGLNIAQIGLGLLYIAAILTLWSMINYLRAAWPALMAKG